MLHSLPKGAVVPTAMSKARTDYLFLGFCFDGARQGGEKALRGFAAFPSERSRGSWRNVKHCYPVSLFDIPGTGS